MRVGSAIQLHVARLDNHLPDGTVFMPFCYAEAAAKILTNPATWTPRGSLLFDYFTICTVRCANEGGRGSMDCFDREGDPLTAADAER
jgi:hypothetical protein